MPTEPTRVRERAPAPAPLLDGATDPALPRVDASAPAAPARPRATPRPARPVVADLTPRPIPERTRPAGVPATPELQAARLPGATRHAAAAPRTKKTPFYPRLLRLRHLQLNGWQRAALADGPVAVSVLVVLADMATPWTLIVLPATVAAVVKSHDLLAGLLERHNSKTAPSRPGTAPQRERSEG